MAQSCPEEKQQRSSRFGKPIRAFLGVFGALALVIAPTVSPAFAQVESIDPNDAIDADLETPDYDGTLEAPQSPTVVDDVSTDGGLDLDLSTPDQSAAVDAVSASSAADGQIANVSDTTTYQDDDLIGAAEGVFGKGAKGLAGVIEDILKKQGRPNAYIAGREASGAFIVGLRYGSGKLHHKIEGERPVYWTGPSIGFDVGGNAANSFVLVYNLYDSEELYQRFPAGEGAAYFIGGFHVSYLRSGDKVLIPVRLGAGLRLGANVGYMKFSKKQRWLPF